VHGTNAIIINIVVCNFIQSVTSTWRTRELARKKQHWRHLL